MSVSPLACKFFVILALALPLSGFGACSQRRPSDGVEKKVASSCEHKGKFYEDGASFAEDCNTCSCKDGGVSCTKMGCASNVSTASATSTDTSEATADACSLEGEGHAAGESFPSKDGCNTCSCSASGEVLCTQSACASTEEGQALDFESLLAGSHSSSGADEAFVVRDALTWDTLYAEIAGESGPVPDVDFKTELVVGIIRQHTTGGYAVKITRVAYGDAGLTVQAQVTTPGPGCATTDALTQPHHFVRVALPAEALAELAEVKSANDAEFTTETVVTTCN
jgi:hypothetical protein